MTTAQHNPDALPQLMGEYRPADEWQSHINTIFYGLHGRQLRDFYQTFAAADYRLPHALAADYYDRVVKRDASRGTLTPHPSRLTVMEWGCGNGNLAACFLSHLRTLDKEGLVYPRVQYLLVDKHQDVLDAARANAELLSHRDRIQWLKADVTELAAVTDHSIDRILCSELWNDLPAKLMLRRDGEVEEEYVRPNLSEKKHAAIDDWSGFIRAFEAADVEGLKGFPSFLSDIIWEREYRKADWKTTPYRKIITAFLKGIDEQVLVPVNTGASLSLREAKRLLATDGIGFSAFDAGTADIKLLNDPEKPCYSQVGGQYSFMVNFALLEAVAQQEGLNKVTTESQREFIARSLGVNVMTLMDLLASHHSASRWQPWEQDRLILQTVQALNAQYRSPYQRRMAFPFGAGIPPTERASMESLLEALSPDGVPDTVAYLTEDEVLGSISELERLGYDRMSVEMALRAPSQAVDYCHLSCSP